MLQINVLGVMYTMSLLLDFVANFDAEDVKWETTMHGLINKPSPNPHFKLVKISEFGSVNLFSITFVLTFIKFLFIYFKKYFTSIN